MAKENNKNLIIWAVIALVIGVVIGLLLTNVVTTGSAISALKEAPTTATLDDRRDLRGNNLFINSIYRNNPDLNASIAFESDVKSHKGFYWGRFGESNAFSISPNTASVNNGNSEITIKAPTTIGQPLKIKEINEMIGEDITIDSRDGDLTNSRGGLHLVGDWVEIYGPRDIQISSPFTIIGNQINSIAIDGNVTRFWGGQIIIQYLAAGGDTNNTGNAYACLDAQGTLYRSQTPCN